MLQCTFSVSSSSATELPQSLTSFACGEIGHDAGTADCMPEMYAVSITGGKTDIHKLRSPRQLQQAAPSASSTTREHSSTCPQTSLIRVQYHCFLVASDNTSQIADSLVHGSLDIAWEHRSTHHIFLGSAPCAYTTEVILPISYVLTQAVCCLLQPVHACTKPGQ